MFARSMSAALGGNRRTHGVERRKKLASSSARLKSVDRAPHGVRGAEQRDRGTQPRGPGPSSTRSPTAPPKDWADLLGVRPICSREELKRAHRVAAWRHHPDRGEEEEIMKAVNIAQERLGDMLEIYWTLGIP